MDRSKAPGVVATALIASVLVLLIAAATWAAVDDYIFRENLPAGATVAGVPVGDLTPAAATAVIEQRVKGPILAPLSVSFRGAQATLDPSRFVAVDVEAILEDAAAPKLAISLPERVWNRVSFTPYGRDTTGVVTVDSAKVAEWVDAEVRRVTVPAVDASITAKGSKLEIRPSQNGVSFDTTAAVAQITDALSSGAKTVTLTEVATAPSVDDTKLGKTIFVSRGKRTLVLYNGTAIEKEYRCAVGMPGFPTPLGTFKIVEKRYMPTWSNPGSAWAKGMPSYIGPGPSNPLGTRALNIDSPGIRIHGTNKDYSIGTAASHGCMRMHMKDVEDLYERVKVGTRVIIVS